MHSAALQLAPVLAEKSKVPFYVAGGVLVLWALTVSAGLGLRRATFPFSLGGERIVIAITVVLVLTATSMAVITSGAPARKASAEAPSTTSAAPAAPQGGAPAGAPSTSAAAPPQKPASKKAAGKPAAPASTTLKLAAAAGGTLAYDTKQLSAKAGKVSIDFSNSSPIEHDVTIAQGSRVLGATPVFTSGSKTLTLTLAPGTYTFYCSVPGHRQAGMEGTLRVS
jgi:plastocyanin